MENVFSEININNGDTVLVSSDILKILLYNKKVEGKISPDNIIDMLKEKIGNTGNLLFPTYNWSFCEGKEFDYKKTKSLCGTLSNIALHRKDFKRTKNPIYSLAVYGKDMDHITNLDHKDCFSFNSPFGYLIKKKAKNLFINLHYRVGGFPFVHVVEQKVGVNYRFKKNFKSYYVDSKETKTIKTFSMFVRDISKNIGTTFIREEFDNVLKENNAFNTSQILGGSSEVHVIEVATAFDLLMKNLSNKGNYIYSAKINE